MFTFSNRQWFSSKFRSKSQVKYRLLKSIIFSILFPTYMDFCVTASNGGSLRFDTPTSKDMCISENLNLYRFIFHVLKWTSSKIAFQWQHLSWKELNNWFSIFILVSVFELKVYHCRIGKGTEGEKKRINCVHRSYDEATYKFDESLMTAKDMASG